MKKNYRLLWIEIYFVILATSLLLKCRSAIMQNFFSVWHYWSNLFSFSVLAWIVTEHCHIVFSKFNLEVLYNFCVSITPCCCPNCFYHCINRAFVSLLVTDLPCFKIIYKNYSPENPWTFFPMGQVNGLSVSQGCFCSNGNIKSKTVDDTDSFFLWNFPSAFSWRALTILWQNGVKIDRSGCICCLLSHSPEYTWLCRPCHLKASSAKSPFSVDDVFDSTILSHFLLRGTIPVLNPLKCVEVEFGEGFLDAGFDKGVFPLSTKPHTSSCYHIHAQAQ